MGAALIGFDFDTNNLTTEQNLIVSLFGLAGTLLVVYLFMKKVDASPFINLGLRLKGFVKDIFLGLFVGLFAMVAGGVVLSSLNEVLFFKSVSLSLNQLILTLTLFLSVAFSEELVFRGYILRNLLGAFNRNIALTVSSILFALAHSFNPNINWIGFLNLFLAGILMGVSYTYTKNLWFPIALHFSCNFFQTLIGFNVSGQDAYSLFEIKIPKNNILNGGGFGFEGSVISSLIQIILIVGVFIYFKNRMPKEH